MKHIIPALVWLLYLPVAWADPTINCSDNILGSTNVCKGGEIRTLLKKTNETYQLLTHSANRKIAFLAAQDKKSFFLFINSCRNLFSGSDPIRRVDQCIDQTATAKNAMLSPRSTENDLANELRSEKYLELVLVERYPEIALNYSARWFGSLHFGRANSSRLSGELQDSTGKHSFPAVLNNPSELDRTFFSPGGRCGNYCASWWKGEFVLDNAVVTFIVHLHQD